MKYVNKNGIMVLEIGGSAPLIRQAATTQQPLRNVIGDKSGTEVARGSSCFYRKKGT
jgi:hypothetical protein